MVYKQFFIILLISFSLTSCAINPMGNEYIINRHFVIKNITSTHMFNHNPIDKIRPNYYESTNHHYLTHAKEPFRTLSKTRRKLISCRYFNFQRNAAGK